MSGIFRKSTEVYQHVRVTRRDAKSADCRQFSPGVFFERSAVGCIRQGRPCEQRKARRLVLTKMLSTNALEIPLEDRTVQKSLERHWEASDANDFDVEHQIYHEDALLDYPQSGERIHGRPNIQESRSVQPNKKRFTVRRIVGSGDLWVTEFTLTYDGKPSYAVSIMEFRNGLVAHETQYFSDSFEPSPSRAHLIERMTK